MMVAAAKDQAGELQRMLSDELRSRPLGRLAWRRHSALSSAC